MADLVDCPPATIKAVELLRLSLSAGLAERISQETGVHINWLMRGDPNAPIMGDNGKPWQKEAYFDAQGKKLISGTVFGHHYAMDNFNFALAKALAALVAVAEAENIRAYTYKLSNAMDGAVSELKNYRELVSVFESIMMNQRKDSQKGVKR